MSLKKSANCLRQQIHQTVLEVNLDAISHNLNEFRRHLNPGTRIMAMVKAFAYGAGPAEISALLEYHRVSYLAVAYVDEGVELRNSGVYLACNGYESRSFCIRIDDKIFS